MGLALGALPEYVVNESFIVRRKIETPLKNATYKRILSKSLRFSQKSAACKRSSPWAWLVDHEKNFSSQIIFFRRNDQQWTVRESAY